MKMQAANATIACVAILALFFCLKARADFGDDATQQSEPQSQPAAAPRTAEPLSENGLPNMDMPDMSLPDMGLPPLKDASPLPGAPERAQTRINPDQLRATRKQVEAMQDEQTNMMMQQQMQEVASYMGQWCMRNTRFPEQSGEWKQKYDVERQLCMLVQNNPYALSTTMQAQGCWQGLTQVASSNPTGMTQTGAPSAFQYSESQIYNESNGRVNLVNDDSLAPDTIDSWIKDPPQDWHAAPGSITCIGSNHGLLMVWGAGRDGKPIRNVLNGETLIISTSWGINEQDMIAPNEGD